MDFHRRRGRRAAYDTVRKLTEQAETMRDSHSPGDNLWNFWDAKLATYEVALQALDDYMVSDDAGQATEGDDDGR